MFEMLKGKKTELLKTKTNTYCHERFTSMCSHFRCSQAELLRNLAILGCALWSHPRYSEIEKVLNNSPLNEQAIINDIIDTYLESKSSESNVTRIDRKKLN